MKLNKDGTIDGTPAEIAEYQRLMELKGTERALKGLQHTLGDHFFVVDGHIFMHTLE